MEGNRRKWWGLTYNLGAHIIDQAVQLFGMPEALFADIATLRDNGKVDDYFVIHFLKPSKYPGVKVTLKASYLMCEAEPRFILHGTEGSYVKFGLDPQEADLTKGLLPNTPHWGEEDQDFWGMIHTEKRAMSSEENILLFPAIMVRFMKIFISISMGEQFCKAMRKKWWE